jgi:ATP-dependent helicase/nuclease subunit B
MRALLDRARVTVADETGWKLSTTRAAAALAAWFDVVASRADTAALLDLLKSPFVLADLPDKSRQVMRIEAALRGMNVLGGWEAVAAALRELPEEAATLQRIADSAARFTRRKTLSEWLALTDEMLDALDMRIALAADAAGEQVLAMLAAFAQDYQAFTHPFSFAEWRALVCMQLESTDFVPLVSDRRVVMLPLNGARLRSFDAVLLVGADAAHLPSHAQESLFFGDAVRRELDLPTRASLQLQQLRDFAELLSANADVVLSWQTHKSEEDNPVSPWIARLELALARAGKQLREHAVAIAQCKLQATPVAMPAPSAPQLLPEKISASAYNSLAACPYQFFAQRMLGLSALEELSDLPQKRDYGDWLHKILKNYHDAVREQKVPLPERAALLRQISDEIFGGVLNKNAAALGYYMRWQKAMPAYLDWANERESEGWQIEAAEKWFEKRLQWPGGEVTLHGRIDRIDSNDAGEWAVLDYKTSNLSALRGKLGQREDHQLAFYGLLADRPVAAAHYVALEPLKEKTGDVAAPNYGEWQQQLSAQIVNNLRAIGQGAALPAAGIEAVCVYCDVRGLCRKGAW